MKKRPVTYFTLGVVALALSNCARHPAPVDPSSVGANPVTLSHEAAEQQKPELTSWGHFVRGVRGLNDPFDLTRDVGSSDGEIYTKEKLVAACVSAAKDFDPDATPDDRKRICEKEMGKPDSESRRQTLNGGLETADAGLAASEVVGSVVLPSVMAGRVAWDVAYGFGNAIVGDVDHYVLGNNTGQDGSQIGFRAKNLVVNTAILPWNVAKAGWGFLSGTGNAIVSLFSSDESPAANQVAQPVLPPSPSPRAARAELKQKAAEQVEASASPISAERQIIMKGAGMKSNGPG